MSKTPSAQNPESYRSPVKSGVRFIAQDVMLKSFVWSICKVEVHGTELLENVDAPFIVIANHSSHLDASLILGSLPRRLSKHVATGAAADYFFDKKLKALTTSLFFNAYPVERKGSGTHRGLTGRLLDAGIPLLIFPEGTRSRTGAMGTFKPGVAALSIARSVPCIPMALVGAYAAWPYSRSMPPTNHPDVHVVIGHPMTAHSGESPQDFAARMQRNVAEMYNSTARAYGMYTLDDYARNVALKKAEDEAWALENAAAQELAASQELEAQKAPEQPDATSSSTRERIAGIPSMITGISGGLTGSVTKILGRFKRTGESE
ncbi:MAG: 1-acyl-sn-glycerol-3-phosphate acyltransferase [Propionibacteriaceae bacterium]|jgi:1-acyl-sn-glycerol-3-phosphate acyltransferase|nr:1-acyl-sn-glycerol-3-phosphate acyltransferase [Propionibacteriaceae bacterium]